MRILLLNDNPVVRKLVALSAQKTKDDLNVVWSVDEIEHPQYDLLIVDDAHYSDDVMTALKEKIEYKSSLLMATRGAAVPAGFDKVINKPFLPTDLVELFIGIANTLPTDAQIKAQSKPTFSEEISDKASVIDLDTLLDMDDESISLDDYDLGDLLDEESPAKTNVLDHDEVQELQGLLDDTDEIEDEFAFDESAFETQESKPNDSLTMEDLDDDFLVSLEEPKEEVQEEDVGDIMSDSSLDSLVLDELEELVEDEDSFGAEEDEFEELMEEAAIEGTFEEEESDDALSEAIEQEEEMIDSDELEALFAEAQLAESLEAPLSDDEFDDLEQQIQEAVGELDTDDLGKALDDLDLGGLDLEGLDDEFSLSDDLEGLDESLDEMKGLDELDDLDSIDEREIKLAIGEEVEEEVEIRVGSGENSSLGAEALSEAMGRSPSFELEDEFESESVSAPAEQSTPAEGVEALQALLKALSNEEVTKALKGLNIHININFGNDK